MPNSSDAVLWSGGGAYDLCKVLRLTMHIACGEDFHRRALIRKGCAEKVAALGAGAGAAGELAPEIFGLKLCALAAFTALKRRRHKTREDAEMARLVRVGILPKMARFATDAMATPRLSRIAVGAIRNILGHPSVDDVLFKSSLPYLSMQPLVSCLHFCVACGRRRKAFEKKRRKYRLCRGCNRVRYCSKKHQKLHWATHKAP